MNRTIVIENWSGVSLIKDSGSKANTIKMVNQMIKIRF